jgi:tight adherence protein B
MTQWLEQQLGIIVDDRTVLFAGAVVATFTFLLILAFRWAWSSIATVRAVDPIDEEPDLFPDLRPKKGATERFDEAFDQMVHESGLGLTTEQALAWTVLAGTGGAAAIYIARPELYLALIGAAIGVGLTLFLLSLYQARHRRRIQDQMPDVFHMLARSTRAGLTIEQAIEMLGQERKIILAPEFRRCSARIELGMPAVAALERMSRRLDLIDFEGLVAVVGFHQGTGGNLPLLLDRLATGTRDHNQFRTFVRSATALGRTSAIVIGLSTPVILLAYAIIQPDFATLFFQSTYGWSVVAIALGLDLIGVVWLFRLLKIEY